jgi:transposase-like protein
MGKSDSTLVASTKEKQINSKADVKRKIQQYGGIDKIIDEWTAGKRTLKDIALEIGISPVTLQVRVHKHNNSDTVRMRKTSDIIEEYGIERIIEQYLGERKQVKDIAMDIGVSNSSLYLYLKRHGYPTSTDDKELAQSEYNSKDRVNSSDIKSFIEEKIEVKEKKLEKQLDKYEEKHLIKPDMHLEDMEVSSELRKELKKLETQGSTQNCMNCMYRNRTDGACWYTMVTNKFTGIENGMCKHYIDRRDI